MGGEGFNLWEWLVTQWETTMKMALGELMTSILSFMDSGLNTVTGNAYVNTFLTSHPSTFTGSVNGGGGTVWSMIETICNTAVVPIAGLILTIVLVTDLIQMCMSGNNFRDFDIGIFMKWIIKAACGIILVSNVFYITAGVFTIGSEVASVALSTLNNNSLSINGATADAFAQSIVNADMEFGTIFVLLLQTLILWLAVYVMVAVIIMTMCSRMIEIFMMLGVSPVPMATFMGMEWKQIGHNWLRNILALAFQALFIIIVIAIFKVMFVNALHAMIAGLDTIALQMTILLGFTLAMICTILRSGNIAKSVFGAH